MCKCTPNIKTPFCGKPGCEWPPRSPKEIATDRLRRASERLRVANAELDSAEREHSGALQALENLEAVPKSRPCGCTGGAFCKECY
jgi:hypothetical protein